MVSFFKKHSIWLLPILLMGILAPFTPGLDLKISRHFYTNGHFSHSKFLKMIFLYGPLPTDLVALGTLLVLLGSPLFPYLKKWRSYALYLLLTLVIGSGLIVHVVLKDHWGRPRPKQIEEFGGKQTFRPFYSPNFFHQPEPSKSFPCGHCSVGFFFFSFLFLGKRLSKPSLFYFGLISSLFLGILLSYTRIAQGGHFFSDTLFSALIMWETAFIIDKILFDDPL